MANTKICPECGKEFQTTVALKKGRPKKYCTTQCRRRIFERTKYAIDPNYRTIKLLRRRYHQAVKQQHTNKCGNTVNILGCSLKDFKFHIEQQFKPGMTWKNHRSNGWHLDHIIPCASFDLKDPLQQKKCFHYTNIQPLWWFENLKKSNNIIIKMFATTYN